MAGDAGGRLSYKIAAEEDEFEQIHRLNYRTFVEEIPQHAANAEGRLVDRFHEQNCYVIALDQRRLVGMVALRGERPFSLDAKLPDLDAHLPPGRRWCEIRLLAVEPAYRGTAVFARLVRELAREGLRRGYDAALISGTTRQLRLYRHFGFQPFGPLTGAGAAQFQPMMLFLETFADQPARSVGVAL